MHVPILNVPLPGENDSAIFGQEGREGLSEGSGVFAAHAIQVQYALSSLFGMSNISRKKANCWNIC